jgi:sec-independent protein translocase protein TatC
VNAPFDDEADIEASRAPLLEHLIELRRRLIICIAALGVGFIACFFLSKQILLVLFHPFEVAQTVAAIHRSGGADAGPFDVLLAMVDPSRLGRQGPPANFIATGPLESLFTQIKVALFGAVVVTFPMLAFQLYRFVAPGLYRRERKAFLPFLIASPILFLLGAALVYFVMLPFILNFSLAQQIYTPTVQVQLLPKISDYFNLVIKLVLGFGLCFQLPVVLTLAGMAGLLHADTLAKGRRYAIVGITILAAIVTPPDMVSPFLLGVPLYLLYEVSIWCIRLIEHRRAREEQMQQTAA